MKTWKAACSELWLCSNSFGSLSYSDEWGMPHPKWRYPTCPHHCCNEALQNNVANPNRGCASHLSEFHLTVCQKVQGQWLTLFFFSLLTYKSWHTEGPCRLSQRTWINKTLPRPSYKSNLMRSDREMCGGNGWTCQLTLCWSPSASEIMTGSGKVGVWSMAGLRNDKQKEKK